jgi:hypothetical protein
VGVGVELPGGNRFKLRLPLWVREPSSAGDPWNLRWRLVVGS